MIFVQIMEINNKLLKSFDELLINFCTRQNAKQIDTIFYTEGWQSNDQTSSEKVARVSLCFKKIALRCHDVVRRSMYTMIYNTASLLFLRCTFFMLEINTKHDFS